MIKAVIFDFGGVLADEGFQEGLYAIARRHGLDEESFFQQAVVAVYDTGYVTGTGTEARFWNAVREQSGIKAPDPELRAEILSRFVLRPWMLELVRRLRQQHCRTAILSDQSDWLDILEADAMFFQEFDLVWNSYHLGKTKRQQSIFPEIARALGVAPGAALFVDDNPGHIERAAGCSMQTHLFTDRQGFERALDGYGLL